MADPTPEELQQQIDELKSLITTEYEPPSGSEYSYPVVNQPMNDEMWSYVTLGLGDGVLDEGGQPYWMVGRENVNNTVRITVSNTKGTAQALLRGFYHRLTQDKIFTVPGVSSATTFHFCLTYDPTAATTPGGPISLQMYAGTPPTSQGRFHIVLWRLVRSPNQLLTDAKVERVRPKITPMITVDKESDMPDANTVLHGTRCVVTATMQEFRSTGSTEDGPRQWSEMKNIYVTPDNQFYEWRNQGAKPASTRIGPMVVMEGRIFRTNNADFYASSTDGYKIHQLPVDHRPQRERRFITKGPNLTSADTSSTIVVSSNGEVRAYPHRNVQWVSLDGCAFTVREDT